MFMGIGTPKYAKIQRFSRTQNMCVDFENIVNEKWGWEKSLSSLIRKSNATTQFC